MANLTRSQRHNRNLDRIFDHYEKHQNSLPCEQLLNSYYRILFEKHGVAESEAKSKYTGYTVKQWEQVLSLSWNKN